MLSPQRSSRVFFICVVFIFCVFFKSLTCLVLSESVPDHTRMHTCTHRSDARVHMCTYMYTHAQTRVHALRVYTHTHAPAPVHTHANTLSPSFPLFPAALTTDLHAICVYLAGCLSGAPWSVRSLLDLLSLQCMNTDQVVFVGWMNFRLLQRNGSALGLVIFLHGGCRLRQSSRKRE